MAVITTLALLRPLALASSTSSSSSASASSSNATASLTASASTLTGVLDDLSGSDSIAQGPALVATAMLLFGVFVALAGSRFVKPIVFIEAFILGGYAFATLVDSALVDWSYAVIASWSSFLIGGIIFAAVVLSIYHIGVALAGVSAGAVLAYVLFIFLGRPLDANEPIMVLVVLCIICGALGGLAAWSSASFVFIATTSWTGAGLIIYAIGYFAGGFPNALGLKAFWKDQAAGVAWQHAFPGGWWGYLLGFVLLFAAGVAAQLHLERVLDARRCNDDGCSNEEHGPECGLEFVVTPLSSYDSGGKHSWSGLSGKGDTPSSCSGSVSTPESAARREKYASQPGFLV